jgi:aspartyl-tRNA(Asn)/glutamyl-tRNA(Gln) amidotransferase subunit B
LDLHRRKLWGDRFTWLLVAVATGVIVSQYLTKRGVFQRYLLYTWGGIVIVLLLTELRVGRRHPRPSPRALYAGWAKYVGEERTEDGERRSGWTGAASGVLEFVPFGIHWSARPRQPGPEEIVIGWPELHGWRMHGVVPLVWRASGYLTLTVSDGRELVFHVQGLRRWRKALREAAIVGPTFVRPDWLPDEAAPELPYLLADAIQSAGPALEMPAAIPRPPAPEPAREQPAIEPEAEPEPVRPPEYEPVIGLECHVELSTASKVFCGCPTTFGAAPNTQVCPVCTGQPGTLPVINEKAVEYAVRIAVALNCRIAPESIFHRKNYFYPDMPKNYQISQYDIPLATDGFLAFEVDGRARRVGIHRVHLEEDTGKTSHAGGTGRIAEAEYTRVDYNRAGVPLVEIVSEPEIRNPEEARTYLAELRALLESLGVSDVRMEQGSLRCDANVSVRPAGSDQLGTKAEVKNMNSMRLVQRALEFEIERQMDLLREGKAVVQETRHFDEDTGRTSSLRTKEYEFDYRYFPDPDLVPLAPDPAWIEQIRASLPERPADRRRRFVDELGLTPVDAHTLTASAGLADAFEAALRAYGKDAKPIANWYTGGLAEAANERGVEPHRVGVTPEHVAELQLLVDSGDTSVTLAKQALKQMIESGKSAREVIAESGLVQIDDLDSLAPIVDEVMAANPDVVEKIRGGKETAVNQLVGQVMQRTRGQARAPTVIELIKQRLNGS